MGFDNHLVWVLMKAKGTKEIKNQTRFNHMSVQAEWPKDLPKFTN